MFNPHTAKADQFHHFVELADNWKDHTLRLHEIIRLQESHADFYDALDARDAAYRSMIEYVRDLIDHTLVSKNNSTEKELIKS